MQNPPEAGNEVFAMSIRHLGLKGFRDYQGSDKNPHDIVELTVRFSLRLHCQPVLVQHLDRGLNAP